MFVTTVLVAALSILARAANPARYLASAPTVDVGYTSFLGNTSIPGVHFFGGIRYAQPPLGPLRWRPPQALDETPKRGAQKNVTAAGWFGDICLQQPATLGSEGVYIWHGEPVSLLSFAVGQIA